MNNKLTMVAIILGFCVVLMGAAPAKAPTPDEQRAALTAEFKDLSQQYQILKLSDENNALKEEKIAKRASEIQEALKKFEPKKEGKDKGK